MYHKPGYMAGARPTVNHDCSNITEHKFCAGTQGLTVDTIVEEEEENKTVGASGCEGNIWSVEMAGNQYLNKQTMISQKLSIQLGC